MSTIPSLALIPSGYKASKVYSVLPTDGSGDLTFTRALDTATRVRPDGLIEGVGANVPRLDYLGGGCPSLLLEPQRTNLITFSEQIDNAAYTNFEFTTINANVGTSPDGFLTAEKLIPEEISDFHRVSRSLSGITTAIHTFSVFVKRDGYDFFLINVVADATNNNIGFDLVNKIVTFFPSGFIPFIESYSNDWYRIGFVRGFTASNPTISFRTQPTVQTDNVITNFIGNGTSGALVWGCQLEVGNYRTSYIPTLAAAVTRSADAASKTGISALIGQTEGTLFLDLFASGQNSDSNAGFSILSDITGSVDAIQIFTNNGLIGFVLRNPSTILITSSFTIAKNTNIKVALGYSSGNSSLFVNGTQVATSSIALSLSNLNDFAVNKVVGGDLQAQNNYSQALLFKTRLTNAQLAELTA